MCFSLSLRRERTRRFVSSSPLLERLIVPAFSWRLGRMIAITFGALVAAAIAGATMVAWRPMGARAEGSRLARMEQSPQWSHDTFVNPQPLVNHFWDAMVSMMRTSDVSTPPDAVPIHRVTPAQLAELPASGLRVTWFGHATTLVEIDSVRLLLDPVWSIRPTPILGIGPERWYPPVIALADLPPIDAVLISHDHYDHLDLPTVMALAERGTPFIVPLGVGAHLEYWGIDATQIVELDWWDSTRVSGVDVVSTPARHASGRMLFDKDATLWSGYAMVGPRHRVYYSGDTGLFPDVKTIGERYGPFDCTLIEVGQYHRAWPDWHIGPEQAVAAHALLRGRVMFPVHWGLFRLAYHGWTEPIERVLAAAQLSGAIIATPRPGESVEPTLALTTQRWWPSLPWETARQHPIQSTQLTGAN